MSICICKYLNMHVTAYASVLHYICLPKCLTIFSLRNSCFVPFHLNIVINMDFFPSFYLPCCFGYE